jgi:hypothetical protein
VARAFHASLSAGWVLVGTGQATAVLEVVEQFTTAIGWSGEPKWAAAPPGTRMAKATPVPSRGEGHQMNVQ